MFKMTINQDGNARAWEGLTKEEVLRAEYDFLRDVFLNGFKEESWRKHKGATLPGPTNPRTSTFVWTVEEDGVLWTQATFVWPKWGDENQALLDGMMAALMKKQGPKVAAKEHKAHK